MTSVEERLLDALRCAIHGEAAPWGGSLQREERGRLFRLAQEHNVLPLLAEAIYASLDPTDRFRTMLVRRARAETVRQARCTGEFLLLYRELQRRGLQPTVLKGLVCRSLYPEPEQRPSTDEDMLASEAEFPAIHRALTELGFTAVDPEAADEVTYLDERRGLYLEVHRRPFPTSEAYGDCNAPFDGALDRTVTIDVQDVKIRTLAPTDHLLYLICHAYKHLLHGGVGIRQICDMGLFAERFRSQLDEERLLTVCRELRIDRLAAALFAIGQKYLDLEGPAIFAGYDTETEPLLEDVLTGGVYGVSSLDRAHSSTITLEAVAADRTGRRSGGILRSVFLPARDLKGRYPYLRKHPWLLPAAWGRRIWDYLFRQKNVDPARSVRIGRQRIALLRRYGVID